MFLHRCTRWSSLFSFPTRPIFRSYVVGDVCRLQAIVFAEEKKTVKHRQLRRGKWLSQGAARRRRTPLLLPPHTRSFDRVPERVASAPDGTQVMGEAPGPRRGPR